MQCTVKLLKEFITIFYLIGLPQELILSLDALDSHLGGQMTELSTSNLELRNEHYVKHAVDPPMDC